MVFLTRGVGPLGILLTVFTNAQKVTIDDQNGDEKTGQFPIYSPSAIWSQGADCSECHLQPNPSYAFDGTWHDSTYDPTQKLRPGIPSFALFFEGQYYDVLQDSMNAS